MRVLYVEPSVVPESLIGAAVDRPFIADRTLATRVSAVHDALLVPDGGLEAETRLHLVVDRLTELLAGGGPAAPDPTARSRPRRGRPRRASTQTCSTARRSRTSPRGWTSARPPRPGRSAPPSGSRRTRTSSAAGSRRRAAQILDGQSLAEVAAETGFVDQAHLTRRFKRLVGTTPGRYATSVPPLSV